MKYCVIGLLLLVVSAAHAAKSGEMAPEISGAARNGPAGITPSSLRGRFAVVDFRHFRCATRVDTRLH